MILGENILALLVLALGGALAVGNLLALVRPKPAEARSEDDLDRPPVGRSLLMIGIGLIATVWALASLFAGDPGIDPPAPQ